MVNQHLDHEIGNLEGDVLMLGSLVETAILTAISALRSRNLDASTEVIKQDDQIDDMESAIQLEAVELLRRESPLAADLRRIVALMFIASELERMGDYAEGIAKISVNLGYEAPVKQMDQLPRMGDLAVSMMKRSILTLTTADNDDAAAIALEIEKDDDEVDEIYDDMRIELFSLMSEQPKAAIKATYLLWAAHNIERIADRATNIAERAMYIAKGVMVGGSRQAIAVMEESVAEAETQSESG